MADSLLYSRNNFNSLGSSLAAIQQNAQDDSNNNTQNMDFYNQTLAQIKTETGLEGTQALVFGGVEAIRQSTELYQRFQNAVAKLKELPSTLTGIAEKTAGRLTGRAQQAKDLYDTAKSKISGTLEDVQAHATSVANQAKGAFDDATLSLKDSANLDELKTNFNNFKSDLTDRLSKANDILDSNIKQYSDIADQAKSQIGEIQGKMDALRSSATGELTGLAKEQFDTLAAKLPDLQGQVDKAGAFISSANETRQTYAKQVADQITQEGEKAKSQFADISSKLTPEQLRTQLNLPAPAPRVPTTGPIPDTPTFTTDASTRLSTATTDSTGNLIDSTTGRFLTPSGRLAPPPPSAAAADAPVRSRVAQTVPEDEAILPAPRPSAAPNLPVERPAIELPQAPIETRDAISGRTRTMGDSAGGALPPEPVPAAPEPVPAAPEPVPTPAAPEPVADLIPTATEEAGRGFFSRIGDLFRTKTTNTLQSATNAQQQLLDLDPESGSFGRGFITSSNEQIARFSSNPIATARASITAPPAAQELELLPSRVPLVDDAAATASRLAANFPRGALQSGIITPDVTGAGVRVLPTVPTLPTVPEVPTLPTVPEVPTLPTVPEVPAAATSALEDLGSIGGTILGTAGSAAGVFGGVQASMDIARGQFNANDAANAFFGVQGAKSLGESAVGAVKSAAASLGEQLSGATAAGGNLINAAQETGSKVVTSLSQSASKGAQIAQDVVSNTQNIVGGAAKTGSELATSALDVAKGAGTDLAEGLTEASLAVLPVIGEVAGIGLAGYQIYEGFKDLFTHPSAAAPPTVAVPTVANISQGFQSGI